MNYLTPYLLCHTSKHIFTSTAAIGCLYGLALLRQIGSCKHPSVLQDKGFVMSVNLIVYIGLCDLNVQGSGPIPLPECCAGHVRRKPREARKASRDIDARQIRDQSVSRRSAWDAAQGIWAKTNTGPLAVLVFVVPSCPARLKNRRPFKTTIDGYFS